MAKHIFVTGGVVSSLGKGLTSASIGMLLEKRGLSVRMQKLDPYINVDPGTMSPYQHGEVYVLDDGSETDLDLGHYERFTSSPFSLDIGKENCLYIHLTLVPYLKAAGELKTKPTQHSVGLLRQIGIQPDILICRTERSISREDREKIALFCNVPKDAVIEEKDKDFSIYEVPLSLVDHGLDSLIVRKLGLGLKASLLDLDNWRHILHVLRNPKHEIS